MLLKTKNHLAFVMTFWLVTGCISTPASITPKQSTDTQPVVDNTINNTPADPEPTANKPLPLVTPAVITHDNLWLDIRDQFSLQQADNPRIEKQLQWYRDNPSYLKSINQRAAPYLYHIAKLLRENDLPLELIMIPIVESAFDPFAYSHSRAVGLWQFLPWIAKHYGVEINWWYDGRRDIHHSTLGAIKFLKDLHQRFDGDWLHVLAAYNSGEGRVRAAIRKNRANQKPTDFWSLPLYKETREHVPKLLALAKLLKNADDYQFEWPHIANQENLSVINIEQQLDLSVAADLADVPLEKLHRLNPGYNRWATIPNQAHSLLVPTEVKAEFEQKLAKLPDEKRVRWVRHQVKSGDSLSKLAVDYQTTKHVIQEVNQLQSNVIVIGQHLMVPVARKSLSEYSLSEQQRLSKTQNKKRGQHKIQHTVVPGDTLWDISRHYKVGLTSLASWNQMSAKDPIKPGMNLVIWKNAPKGAKASSVIRRLSYTVRRGDSLSRIASKFNINVSQILQWNSIKREKYLQPGQKLRLFVDVTDS